MKRSAAGGLILSVLVFTGLGVAGSLIRFKPCRSCEGLVQYFIQKADPVWPPFGLRCPDCADRGKVSLFRSWMGPRVAPNITALLRGLKDPHQVGARHAFRSMVEQSRPDSAEFFKAAIPNFQYFEGAGFLEAKQKTYLALFSYLGPGIVRKSDGITVILLSAEGKALDFIQVTWMTSLGLLSAIVEDGGEVVVKAGHEYAPGFEGPYQLVQWGGATSGGKAKNLELCRLTVRGDRLVVIRNK